MKQKLLNPPEEHNSHTEQHGTKENGVGFFFLNVCQYFLVCICDASCSLISAFA